MGREVRMVPKDWEHPKRSDGNYLALYEGTFLKNTIEDWDKSFAEWNSGNYPSYATDENIKAGFVDWEGERPKEEDYMPLWTQEEATHYMMYQNTSEGTPISPAFESPEDLAEWLYKSGASAFGRQTASYEGWLRVANGGYACSAVKTSEGMTSGVDGLTESAP